MNLSYTKLKPILIALFDHFQNVLAHSNANRMAAQNIAIVFGPTLIQSVGVAIFFFISGYVENSNGTCLVDL